MVDNADVEQVLERTDVLSYPLLGPDQTRTVTPLLVDLAATRFPHRLSEAQRAELASVIAAQLAQTERLHAYKLSNADEPLFAIPAPGHPQR